nr:hypothetical protein [Tanacetum cinerariifolium]
MRYRRYGKTSQKLRPGVWTRTACKEGDPGAGDGVPDGSCCGAGFAGSCAVERHTYSAAADYGFGDEQP